MREVVAHLERARLDYWLGRGVFRHYRLLGEFGEEQNDLDFHVLKVHRRRISTLVESLCGEGYVKVPWRDLGYKIPLRKGSVPVELIFLERKAGTLYFRAGGVGQKRYSCPISVYGTRQLEICGIRARVPEDEYLPLVYGPNWEAEERDNGRKLIR